MHRIHPVTEGTCRTHYGKMVLIYMKDGTEVYGRLSKIKNGQLFLNEEPVSAASSTAKKVKNLKTKSAAKKAGKAQVGSGLNGGFGEPYVLGYNRKFALDLEAVAFLFAF